MNIRLKSELESNSSSTRDVGESSKATRYSTQKLMRSLNTQFIAKYVNSTYIFYTLGLLLTRDTYKLLEFYSVKTWLKWASSTRLVSLVERVWYGISPFDYLMQVPIKGDQGELDPVIIWAGLGHSFLFVFRPGLTWIFGQKFRVTGNLELKNRLNFESVRKWHKNPARPGSAQNTRLWCEVFGRNLGPIRGLARNVLFYIYTKARPDLWSPLVPI